MIYKYKKNTIKILILGFLALIAILFGVYKILGQDIYQLMTLFFGSILIVFILGIFGFLAGFILSKYKKK